MRSKRTSSVFPLILAALFVGLSAGNAHAYLDAGTGSMILQLLLGGIAGLAIAGKLYWYKFKAMLGFAPKPSLTEESETVASSEARAE
jgi:hypothetical protein